MTIPSSEQIRRVDHIALLVASTADALTYFSERLGLPVLEVEELETPRVRMTYLDAGNVLIQLIEPLDGDSELARALAENGEGVHHLCFGVRDVERAIGVLSDSGSVPPALGHGRGRVSGFLAGDGRHGVRIECTEFSFPDDVERVGGWLPDGTPQDHQHDDGRDGKPTT